MKQTIENIMPQNSTMIKTTDTGVEMVAISILGIPSIGAKPAHVHV